MKRTIFTLVGAALVAALSAGVTWTATKSRTYFIAEKVTTCRVSPDDLMRVWLVELHSHIQLDRNVAIRLEDINRMETVDLLKSSPNEGFPAGSERFVWSVDGSKVVLVGRHFFVREKLDLASGEQIYFLHDLKAHRTYLNSAGETGFLPLTADLLAGVEFTEPIALKPATKVDPDSAPKGE